VVVELEHAVVLDDPPALLGHERPQHGTCHLAVGVRRKLVSDVMQQRCHHVLLASTVPVSPRRGLERVLEPRHLVAPEGVLERPEGGQDALGQDAVVLLRVSGQRRLAGTRALTTRARGPTTKRSPLPRRRGAEARGRRSPERNGSPVPRWRRLPPRAPRALRTDRGSPKRTGTAQSQTRSAPLGAWPACQAGEEGS